MDEEDEQKEEDESDLDNPLPPLPPMSQDVLRLSNGPQADRGTSGGHMFSFSGLDEDSDAFNPNWTLADMEFTSLAFGKKTASFVCKSFL